MNLKLVKYILTFQFVSSRKNGTIFFLAKKECPKNGFSLKIIYLEQVEGRPTLSL